MAYRARWSIGQICLGKRTRGVVLESWQCVLEEVVARPEGGIWRLGLLSAGETEQRWVRGRISPDPVEEPWCLPEAVSRQVEGCGAADRGGGAGEGGGGAALELRGGGA